MFLNLFIKNEAFPKGTIRRILSVRSDLKTLEYRAIIFRIAIE